LTVRTPKQVFPGNIKAIGLHESIVRRLPLLSASFWSSSMVRLGTSGLAGLLALAVATNALLGGALLKVSQPHTPKRKAPTDTSIARVA
jgi:hypothetical protein